MQPLSAAWGARIPSQSAALLSTQRPASARLGRRQEMAPLVGSVPPCGRPVGNSDPWLSAFGEVTSRWEILLSLPLFLSAFEIKNENQT